MQLSLIEINDLETWPKNLIALLKARESILIDYRNRQQELLNLRSTDYIRSLAPNQFYSNKQKVLSEIESIIAGLPFVGYHCTRLTPNEEQNILSNGLRISSKGLFLKRIKNALNDQFISEFFYKILKSTQVSNYTSGEIWVFFGELDLKKEDGIGDLLEYWGGEALYRSLSLEKKLLRMVGSPCIVKILIDLVKETNKFNPGNLKVATAIENFYFFNKGLDCMNIGVELPLKTFVSPKKILKIIKPIDSEFSLLTDLTNWKRKF